MPEYQKFLSSICEQYGAVTPKQKEMIETAFNASKIPWLTSEIARVTKNDTVNELAALKSELIIKNAMSTYTASVAQEEEKHRLAVATILSHQEIQTA